MSPYDVIRGPVVTEKAETIRALEQTLCFRVDPRATKTDVKNAVHRIFGVDVEGVRTINYKGKLKRRGRYAGYRPDWKKAYVTLAEGESIPELS